MRRRIVTGLVAAVLAGLGAAGCGDDGGRGTGTPADGEFDIDVGDDLPDDFPTDAVPLPDGEITKAASIGGGSGQSWTIAYDTDDPTAAAVRYRDELTGAGFTVEESLTTDDDDLESFVATGSGYIVNAFAGAVPGGTGPSVLSVSVARLE